MAIQRRTRSAPAAEAPAEEAPPRRRGSAPAQEEAAPTRPSSRSRSAPRDSADTSLYSGDAMMEMAEKDKAAMDARREKGFMPFRFWVPQGEEREVIILDAEIRKGIAFYEHNLKGPDGKFGNFEICIKDRDNCPVCEKHPDSHAGFVIMLTVLDLTPFTSKKTKQEIPWSRKLLVLKQSYLPTFKDIEAKVLKLKGTLRGTSLILKRDTGATQNSPSIGVPIAYDNGMLFQHYTEKQLIAEFGNDVEIGRDKKVLKEENEDITPFPYSELFQRPDPDELRERYGLAPQAGSAKERLQQWDGGDKDQQEDNGGAAPARRERPAAGRRRGNPLD